MRVASRTNSGTLHGPQVESMGTVLRQAWLILRNDLRLLWRDFRAGKMKAVSSVVLIGIVIAIFQALTILLFSVAPQPPLQAEAVVWFFVGFVMLGSAMNHAVTVLFERADFDLLLSAPVSPTAILLARLCGMTVAAGVAVGIFFLPVINGAAIGLTPRYLFGYAVWLMLAMIVTACGVWLTLLLVRWLGPRRARTWAQVIAAILGATVYILFQIQNSVPYELRSSMTRAFARLFSSPLVTSIARAGHGEPISLASFFVLAVSAGWLTTRLLGRTFVTGIQDARVVRTARARARSFQFADGLLHATFKKDVRLIVRDPILLTRVLPSVFYLAPVLFPAHRLGNAGVVGVLAPFAVIACVILSQQLTAVSAAGEEGWDLIRLSPASTVTLRLAKMAAGMALPGLVAFGVCVSVATLGRPGVAIVALVSALVSAAGICWLEVASMRPTPRKDLIQRSAGARRSLSPSRIIANVGFLGIGTTAPVLAANELWWWTSLALGAVVLFAIACFTLIEMQDIEFEAAPTPLPPGNVPAKV